MFENVRYFSDNGPPKLDLTPNDPIVPPKLRRAIESKTSGRWSS